LNFAGVADDDIREGVRRIGEALGGQAGLFGALTGSSAAPSKGTAAESQPTQEVPEAGLADVVRLPLRPDEGQGRRRRDR